MAEGSHAGRPSSWLAVGVMMVGSVLGGLGLVVGPSWPLFWAGLAVTALGGVLGLAFGILQDVVVDQPRDITAGVASAVGTSAASGATVGASTTSGASGTSGTSGADGVDGAETPAEQAETAESAG